MTGFPELLQLVESASGVKIQEVVEVLDTSKRNTRRKRSSKMLWKRSFLEENAEELRKSLSRTAVFSARKYSMNMILIENWDSHQNRKT